MKHIVFIFCLCILSFHLKSQQTCSGILLDSLTRQPVEFANIGLIGKGIGTVTDDKGAYKFSIPDSLRSEKIRVSMVGYAARTYAVDRFAGLTRVMLQHSNVTLNEVVVSAKKTKVKIAGNNTKNKRIQAGFYDNGLGAEFAVKLKIKHPQTQLRKFMVNINQNSINNLPVFRFNLYSVDEKGLPKENILNKNIIIEPKEMTGFVTLDLAPYNLYVDNDVFIAIEWIKDLGDAKGLYFSTELVGPTYYRKVSQDKWHKVELGVGLHAEIAY